MESIINYFDSLGFDFKQFLIAAGILLLGTFLLSAFGRFVFGKKSALNNAVSSAIGILFIYAVTAIIHAVGGELNMLVAPLPFVSINGDVLRIFSFQGQHYTVLCSEILSMIILSFLVNLADRWLPRGKNIFSWIFFRALTVVIGLLMHLVVVGLLTSVLPEGLVTYAPTVLLGLLILMLLTGALKIVVGALMSTVNPVIGALYTFFFANIIGKQITKAVLTTAILSAIVWALNYFGITAISIASAALIAYIPFVVILIVLWYIVNKIF